MPSLPVLGKRVVVSLVPRLLSCRKTGREPGRTDHVPRDVLCVVLIIELLPMHSILKYAVFSQIGSQGLGKSFHYTVFTASIRYANCQAVMACRPRRFFFYHVDTLSCRSFAVFQQYPVSDWPFLQLAGWKVSGRVTEQQEFWKILPSLYCQGAPKEHHPSSQAGKWKLGS